jgi:beta-lactamase class D
MTVPRARFAWARVRVGWLATFLCLLLALAPTSVLSRESPVITSGLLIETTMLAGEVSMSLIGQRTWLDRLCAPASTFKVVLALAGLASGGLDLQEVRICRDPHLGPEPRSLALAEALRLSSNDYFLQTGPRIGDAAITATLAMIGLVAPAEVPGWRRGGWNKVHRGGGLRVTPRAQQRFMADLAFDRLPFRPEVLAALRTAMRWPSPHPEVELFGKTGAAGGAVWFIGYGKRAGQWKAVTVFLEGGVARRTEAIALFYRQFGLDPPDR